MLYKLRLKFTFICAGITSFLLIITLIGLFFFTKDQLHDRSIVNLKNQMIILQNYIQTNNTISQSWLYQLEYTNDLIIYIEEYNTPLLFQGYNRFANARNTLIDKAKALTSQSASQEVSYSTYPTAIGSYQCIDFSLEGQHFLASRAAFSVNNVPYTILLLKNLQADDHETLKLLHIFSIIAVICLLLLTLFGSWFAGKAIAPIEENSRQQKAFIAAASHELRSPLAVLETNASALLQKVAPDDMHFLSAMTAECRHLSKLVEDLLLLTNADAENNWTLKLQPAEADTLLLELYDSFYLQGIKMHHQLQISLPEGPVPVCLLDTERLKQILTILIDNAFSHTPEGCKVTLVLTLTERKLCFKVIDNGPGIPDEAKQLVFHRFYCLDQSRHDKSHYGLGLSIAYELTQLHHGTLSIEDTPGGGCSFILLLPLSIVTSSDQTI